MSDLGNKKIFSQNLQKYMYENGIDRNEICKALGFKYTTFTDWFNGNSYPRIDKIEKMASFFGILKSDLIEDKSNNSRFEKPKGIKVPVLGYIKAGIPVDAIEDVIDYEEIPETLAKKGKFFALKVKGDSMEPDIKNGDIAILLVQPDVNSGEIGAIIFNGNNEATLKRIYKDETGITLIPDNLNNKDGFKPTHYTNKEIKEIPITIAGKLMEVRKKYY